MTGSDSIELAIPRRAEYVAVARLSVAAIAGRLRFSIEDVEDVKLAVAEACTGAIARGSQLGGRIELLFEGGDEALHVRVVAFAPLSDLQELRGDHGQGPRIGALGSYLIRALMDEVRYEKGSHGALDLIMSKRQQFV